MTIDLVEYIANRTPKDFLQRAVESLEAAYFQAFREASTYEEPEQRRIQGQIRHYRQNQALRQSAENTGMSWVAAETDPKGERYPLVSSSGVIYGRIGVNFTDRIPRFANHRKSIAALNSRLEPINLDLFNASSKRPSDGLGVLLVTVNPHCRDSQEKPAGIKVGVPYSNCKGWHLFETVESIMAAYEPAVTMEVPDLVLVQLKKKLKNAE
jgi:hypothetical protein